MRFSPWSAAKKALATGLLLGTLFSTTIYAQEKHKRQPFSPFLELDWTLGGLNVPRLTISDVPESFRDIPVHPTDTKTLYRTYPGIVPDQPLRVTNFEKSYNWVNAAIGISFFDALRLGARTGLLNYGNDSDDNQNVSHLASTAGTDWKDKEYVSRRNYATSNPLEKRVSGTAFTYYGFPAFSKDFPKNLAHEVFAEIQYVHKKQEAGISLGYAYEFSPMLTIERGYDRWNRFEVLDRQDMGRIQTQKYYASIFLRPAFNPSIHAGVKFNGGFRTKTRDERVTTSLDDHWFFEMTFYALLGRTDKRR